MSEMIFRSVAMRRHFQTSDALRRSSGGDKPDKDGIVSLATLIAFTVCSILTLGIYLTTSALLPNGGGRSAPEFAGAADGRTPLGAGLPPFQLAGVQLGMTPPEVRALYPGLRLDGRPESERTARFTLGNGAYAVSFVGPDGAKKAYRLTYEETFTDLSGTDVRHRLKAKFGEPNAARCGVENPGRGWVCEFNWWREDGVRYDANTESYPPTGASDWTTLRFTAVDPRVEFGRTVDANDGKGWTRTDRRSRFDAIKSGLRGK